MCWTSQTHVSARPMESFIKLMSEWVGFVPAYAGMRVGNEQGL